MTVPAEPGAAGSTEGTLLRTLRRQVVAFGRFWWDFLAGDAPGLLLGTALVLGLVAGLVAVGANTAAYAVAPLLVVLVLAASAWKASRP